jgi:hypothetical protein
LFEINLSVFLSCECRSSSSWCFNNRISQSFIVNIVKEWLLLVPCLDSIYLIRIFRRIHSSTDLLNRYDVSPNTLHLQYLTNNLTIEFIRPFIKRIQPIHTSVNYTRQYSFLGNFMHCVNISVFFDGSVDLKFNFLS